NPDSLSTRAARKGNRLVIGFAAETHAVTEEARRKLVEKHLDLIVANDVTTPGAGFGADDNQVHLLDDRGLAEALPLLAKDEVAMRILDWVASRRGAGSGRAPRRGEPTRRRSARR